MSHVEAAVRRVRAGTGRATDADEVAALLEANGVNDPAAAGWYGYPSVFALAELVYLMDMRATDPDGSFDHPRSALTLRLVLALFGFVTCGVLAAMLLWAGLRAAALVAGAVAVIALGNAAFVQYRRVVSRSR